MPILHNKYKLFFLLLMLNLVQYQYAFNPFSALMGLLFPRKNNSQITFEVDTFQIQGSRKSQQDVIINETIKGIQFFGITDGHGEYATVYSSAKEQKPEWQNSNPKKYAVLRIREDAKNKSTLFDEGATAANYIAATFPQYIAQGIEDDVQKRHNENILKKIFRSIFMKNSTFSIITHAAQTSDKGLKACLDNTYQLLLDPSDRPENCERYPGTTMTLACVYNNKLWIANTGDSRIVVFDKNNKVIQTTRDHKPNDPDERKRVEAAGGEVSEILTRDKKKSLGFKIHHPASLAVSRSFGDYRARRVGVICEPEIIAIPLEKVNKVIAASDGLYDICDTQDKSESLQKSSTSSHDFSKPTNNMLQKFVHKNPFKKGIAEALVTKACYRGDMDALKMAAQEKNINFSKVKDLTKEQIHQLAHDNISVLIAQKRVLSITKR